MLEVSKIVVSVSNRTFYKLLPLLKNSEKNIFICITFSEYFGLAVCKNLFVTLHSCVCFRRRRGMNPRCLEAVHPTLCLCSLLAFVRRTPRPSWTSTFPGFSRPLAVSLLECCGIPRAPALLNSAPCLGEVSAPGRSLAL